MKATSLQRSKKPKKVIKAEKVASRQMSSIRLLQRDLQTNLVVIDLTGGDNTTATNENDDAEVV